MKKIIILSLIASGTVALGQGSLLPTGGPTPTMKSLDEVAPGTCIQSVPYNITKPGRYYLGTNLTTTTPSSAIQVLSDGVTLDLNGFTLNGTSNGFYGITTATAKGVRVQNGRLIGWLYTAIDAASGTNWTLENLEVAYCPGNGLALGGLARLSGCSIHHNGSIGIVAGDHVLIEDCAIYNNSVSGTSLGKRATVQHCRSCGNGGNGFYAGVESHFTDCIANDNNYGISTGARSKVEHCAGINNASTGIQVGNQSICTDSLVSGNRNYGLSAGNGCSVQGCLVSTNSYNGLNLGDSCSAKNCIIGDNGSGHAGIAPGRNCVIKDCQIFNNGYGVSTPTFGNGTTIANCEFAGHKYNAIYLAGPNNQVLRNVFNTNGISTSYPAIQIANHGADVEDNIITGSYVGIGMQTGSTNCTIIRNKVTGAGSYNYYNFGAGNDVGPIGRASTNSSPFANISN